MKTQYGSKMHFSNLPYKNYEIRQEKDKTLGMSDNINCNRRNKREKLNGGNM